MLIGSLKGTTKVSSYLRKFWQVLILARELLADVINKETCERLHVVNYDIKDHNRGKEQIVLGINFRILFGSDISTLSFTDKPEKLNNRGYFYSCLSILLQGCK